MVLVSLPQAKKSLGQHWLSDTASLESIVDAAHVKDGDVVLEIGPGTGTLTDVLIRKGAEIIALEFDHERAVQLSKKYQSYRSSKIFIEEGDIRAYDFGILPDSYKIVANIPYYLTANLLRKLTDDAHKPTIAALLVQKEVAERVSARPGKLSLIAVLVQNYYTVSVGDVIIKDLFTPPPKVDSQVLILEKRLKPLFDWDERDVGIIKAGFAQMRKKLKSSLTSSLGIERSTVENAINAAGLSENTRAQELNHKEWNDVIQVLR